VRLTCSSNARTSIEGASLLRRTRQSRRVSGACAILTTTTRLAGRNARHRAVTNPILCSEATAETTACV